MCLFLRIRRPLFAAWVVSLLIVAGSVPVAADIISFDSNDWNHGGGESGAWDNGATTGTTTFNSFNGPITLTITSRLMRNAVATSEHMTRINESYFSGFAFQLDPDTATNGGRLRDYLRLDFEFSQEVTLTSFTLTDVDRQDGSWYDIVAAEGFVNGIGTVGSGLDANYSFNNPTNEEVVTDYGLLAARPRSNTGNLQNTPPADVTFSFDEGVRAFSIYYWNDSTADDGSATQTIGIRGNQFEIEAAPEPGSIAMGLLALAFMLGYRYLSRSRAAEVPCMSVAV